MTALLGVVVLGLLYWFPVRRWYHRWGATDTELVQAMPADDAIAKPGNVTTLAVTVDAPREHVWPPLLQMGYRRGGLYSYDCFDRAFGLTRRAESLRARDSPRSRA